MRVILTGVEASVVLRSLVIVMAAGIPAQGAPATTEVSCFRGTLTYKRDTSGRKHPMIMRRTLDRNGSIVEEVAMPGVILVDRWEVEWSSRETTAMKLVSASDNATGKLTLVGPRWQWTAWKAVRVHANGITYTTRATLSKTALDDETDVAGDSGVFKTIIRHLEPMSCGGYDNSRDIMQIE